MPEYRRFMVEGGNLFLHGRDIQSIAYPHIGKSP